MIEHYPKEWVGRCSSHFAHAIEKHPFFADRMWSYHNVLDRLAQKRVYIKMNADNGWLTPADLIECELAEAEEATYNRRTEDAINEWYDVIAVAMRAICVLEGTQKLGRDAT